MINNPWQPQTYTCMLPHYPMPSEPWWQLLQCPKCEGDYTDCTFCWGIGVVKFNRMGTVETVEPPPKPYWYQDPGEEPCPSSPPTES